MTREIRLDRVHGSGSRPARRAEEHGPHYTRKGTMAHDITERDGMVLVGKRAWHGLGTVIPEGPLRPLEALPIAGLDWSVSVAPVFAHATRKGGPDDGAPYTAQCKGARAIVRDDTGESLAVLSDAFEPVQNRDFATLLEALGRDVETMGSLRGGRVVFGLLRQGEFGLGAGERVRQYILAVNGHDGSRALSFFPTDVRVVCANTLRMAESADGSTAVRFTHRKGIAESVQRAALALEHAEAFVSIRRELSQRMIDSPAPRDFFPAVAVDVLGTDGLVTVEPGSGRLSWDGTDAGARAAGDRTVKLVRAFRAATDHPFQSTARPGSVWHAFQSVSHWAHHVRPGRVEATESRLVGPVSAITSKAWRRARALVMK